jgi:cadmium resistance protein CadD (predicted permease)
MTVAYVQAIVATVLALVGTWTGLVIAVALLLPRQTERATNALTRSPGACFGGGLLVGVALLFMFVLVHIPLQPVKLVGGMGALLLGAVLSIGAAGTARLMGQRIGDMADASSPFANLVRGSVVYSVAMGFPFIGWLIFLPFAVVFGLGAGAAAMLPSRQATTPPYIPGKPEFDITERQGAI